MGEQKMSKKRINKATGELSKKRLLAISILETIGALMGHEDMFDGEQWYEFEDAVTEILEHPNQQPTVRSECG